MSISRHTKEAKNGSEESARLECRRDIARNATRIGRQDIKVFFETCASNGRSKKCAIIAKAESQMYQRSSHNDTATTRSNTHSREPVAITAASKYKRQLYTSFGVGRSSTARNPPMMLRTCPLCQECKDKTNAPVTMVTQQRVQE